MRITDADRIEFASQMAAVGASFEDTFLAFRRTGTGSIHAILAVRTAFPESLSDNVSETATPEEFTVQGDGVVSHVSVYQS